MAVGTVCVLSLVCVVFQCCGDHRDVHVRTHSVPTRRSSDLWITRPGTTCARSVVDVMPTWASRSLVTAVMAIGTFCMLSERLFAVTTISAIPASGGCADSCAAATLAARQTRLTDRKRVV